MSRRVSNPAAIEPLAPRVLLSAKLIGSTEEEAGFEVANTDDGVAGLGEEERRLAIGIVSHLAGVVGVVAADAEDAADREEAAAANGHDGLLRARGALRVIRRLPCR